MGKKSKLKKSQVKENKEKTREEREQFVNRIISKLSQLNIYDKQFQAISILDEKMNTFINTGFSESGKIDFPEFNRRIEYIFTNNKHIDGSVTLLHN